MIKKMLMACGIILLLLSVGLFVFLNQIYQVFIRDPGKDVATQDFVVEEGESFVAMADRLEDQDFIASAFWFRIVAELAGLTNNIQSGVHAIVPKDNYSDILGALTSVASSNEVSVTIPEGYTIKQMGELLARKGLVSVEEWTEATSSTSSLESHAFVVAAQKPDDVDLEGYLFPDTYRFDVEATASDIATIMLDTMEARVDSLGTPSGDAVGYTTHELLTLASIIEREVRRPETMKNVADIFLKRLDIGMALQVDSTVNYVTGGDSPSITIEERDNTDSLYNTYKYPGLPPGPISNPSLNALTAVYNPTPNDYLYFLTTDDGEIYYAKTHGEHVANKARYLH